MSVRSIKGDSVQLEVADGYASAVSLRKQRQPEDFVMSHHKENLKAKLLEEKGLNELGEIDPKHQLALAKFEIWSDGPRFYLKRLPASCFFNPWGYNKGTKNDIRYIDIYGKKPYWVQVTKRLYDLYLQFLVGEENESGVKEHNTRILSQIERMFINEDQP